MLACLPTAVLKTKERQLLPTCCTCAIRHHQELKPQQLMLSFMKQCASTQSPYVRRKIFVDYSVWRLSWTSEMQKHRFLRTRNTDISISFFSFAIFQAILFLWLQKIWLHICSVSHFTKTRQKGPLRGPFFKVRIGLLMKIFCLWVIWAETWHKPRSLHT